MVECVCVNIKLIDIFEFMIMYCSCIPAMDIMQSQQTSIEDHDVKMEILVVEIEALDHGLQREVIVLCSRMFLFTTIQPRQK